MLDPAAVLASTQEREKWRARVRFLEESLRQLRAERATLERRRAQVRRELAHVTSLTRAARSAVGPSARREVMRGRPPSSLP